MNRRRFLTNLVIASVASQVLRSPLSAGTTARRPKILLRSSWQSVNIGDIGHTPGALSLLEKYFPEAEITLWPNNLEYGARDMLVRAYPGVKIVEGTLGEGGRPPAGSELARAWAETDVYVSGSGSGFPHHQIAAAFHRATGKPVGVFGVSTDPISGFGEGRDPYGNTLDELRKKALSLPPGHLKGDMRYVIDNASFMFTRDTVSLDYLKAQQVGAKILEFGPDAQLGMHLRNDEKGSAWLHDHGLDGGRFICVVPRQRYTPYYKIRNTPRGPNDDLRDAINEQTVEKDHAKLRAMMIAYVRATGNKVVACAEMTYQIELAKQVLVDPLPDDVRRNVIWRDSYWLPDEAAAIYARADAVVSVECHSPLIALHNGTPGMYVRQPTDTCKGQMYRDIGAGAWFFEVDETDGNTLWAAVEAVHKDPVAARRKVKEIMGFVEQRQKRMVEAVRMTAAASIKA